MLAQSCHAVIEFCLLYPELTKEYHDISNYICVLSIKSEGDLLKLYNKALQKNVRVSCFREPDINNEMTAVVLEPSMISKKLCSNLPLALSN